MSRNKLGKNLNIILAIIIMIVTTLWYFSGRPDNMSEDTRYLASLIFNFTLVVYNLMMGIYFSLSKKWEVSRTSHFFYLRLKRL